MATSSKRVSVKGYLVSYLLEIGEDLGTDDLSEIVNQLIGEHKRFVRRMATSIIQMPTPEQIRAIEKPGKALDDEAIAASLSGFLDAA